MNEFMRAVEALFGEGVTPTGDGPMLYPASWSGPTWEFAPKDLTIVAVTVIRDEQ